MKNNIEMIENILNTERRNRRGNREIRFEVNSNYYEAVSKLLSDYKRVLKENEQLITEVNSLKKENEELNKYKKESVPKSKVKEKIEELDNKRRKFTSDNVNNFYLQEFTRKYTQKSDHDYGVFSTPETITYCINNELLGRVEALQELLREE